MLVDLTQDGYTGLDQRALALSVAPDGNLMALKRVAVSNLPSGLTTTGTVGTFVLSKINVSNGSVIWNKVINPFTDGTWNMMNVNAVSHYVNGRFLRHLAEMVVDSTGATYVAWGNSGASGHVKYDTNGTLVTTYDRLADTTGETLDSRWNSKPAVVVLPDDSFFWFQYVKKNSTEYLIGSKWDSNGNVIFKNRTLDVSRFVSNWSNFTSARTIGGGSNG